MQEFFPGVGNWMADEILWQARLHQFADLAGSYPKIGATQLLTCWRKRFGKQPYSTRSI